MIDNLAIAGASVGIAAALVVLKAYLAPADVEGQRLEREVERLREEQIRMRIELERLRGAAGVSDRG